LRSQHSNLEDCFRKLSKMVTEACKVPKVRKIRTEPSQKSKARRVEDKRKHSEKKSSRQRNQINKW